MINIEFRHTLPASDVIFGKGSLEKIGEETKKLGNKTLLVTGKSSMKRLGFLDKTIDYLNSAGVEVVHYGEIEPNPTTVMVNEGADLALMENCDVIVALGGGSSIDAAKGIALVAGLNDKYEDLGIWDFAPEGDKETKPITDDTLPVLAAPSTSGTGSHVTPYAVITNPETNGKPGFGAGPTFPKTSIVDPNILKEMPPGLTAVTGFDVFCHVSENVISKGDHPTADPLAFKAIEYVGKYLHRAYEDGDDMEAREKMAVADTYAGMSNTIASTALRHAMAHSISGHYPEIAHGQALASVSEAIMRYNIENGDDKTLRRYSKIAVSLGELDSPDASKKSALKSVEALNNLLESVDLNKSLSELGIGKEKIPQMAEDTFTYMMGDVEMNPVKVDKNDIKEIYRNSY